MDQKQDERTKQKVPEPIEPGHVMCAKKWERVKEQLLPKQK